MIAKCQARMRNVRKRSKRLRGNAKALFILLYRSLGTEDLGLGGYEEMTHYASGYADDTYIALYIYIAQKSEKENKKMPMYFYTSIDLASVEAIKCVIS